MQKHLRAQIVSSCLAHDGNYYTRGYTYTRIQLHILILIIASAYIAIKIEIFAVPWLLMHVNVM